MYFTVEPLEPFAVRIFNDGETVPFTYQPDYPNLDPFESVEEATAWAQASIAAHDPSVLIYAPNGKNLVGETKPVLIDPEAHAAQLAVAHQKLKTLGFTDDDISALAYSAKSI